MLTITGTDQIVRGLHEMLGRWGWFHLESGTDIRSVFGLTGGLPVTMCVGGNVRDVMLATRPNSGSALLFFTPQPLDVELPAVLVGMHGFSTQPVIDGSFPLSLIDDWGVDDVMAAAFDSLGNPASIAVLIDLAVLDVVFEPGSQRARPGGLDPRRLGRAAYLSGRNSIVNNVGLVAAFERAPSDLVPSDVVPSDLGPSDLGPSDLGPSDLVPSDLGRYANLAHVALSFCAGLAAR